ncbi:MAG: GH3 auxin-responsive promoter family protein [Clostridia bacterium]|nr:GH3 auxin-responsive promoter family protein [Clostridia bacterium]
MAGKETLFANKAMAEPGRAIFHQVYDEETKDPKGLQEKFLLDLIADNAETEFGRKYGFADIKTVEEYRKRVPVAVYDDFAPYLERMRNGEKNVLTAYPFDHMNTTSGTVGTPKYVPMTSKQQEVFLKYNFHYNNGLKAEMLPEEWMQGKTFCTSEGTCKKQDNGITIGCASAKNAESLQDPKNPQGRMMQVLYTSPLEAMIPEEGTDTKYIHLRFALMEPDLTGMVTGFYNMLVHLFQYLADNYEMLIDDIEKGTIDESVKMPESVRASLMEKIRPMPERAAELRAAFADGPDKPFLTKIWKNLVYLNGAGGDGLAIYDERIKAKFSGNLVRNMYAGVTASEGLWSVPAGIDTLDSILAAGSAFMEFLPEEAGDDFSQAVLMHELEEGRTYELIITNYCGFYRYRMSDAVKVTGFINETPLVQFMYRVNKTISVALEKTTELALDRTVTRTAEEMGFLLADYCVYPNPDVNPGRYDFLIETVPEDLGKIDMEKLKECVYRLLSEANPRYSYAVEHGQLALPEVHLLQPETGILYREMMIFRGSNPSQLKPVHVIGNERQRKFFFGLIEQ